jgi:tetratricopeptide (TPR) repeat protein
MTNGHSSTTTTEAISLLEQGRYQEAITLFNEQLKRSPGDITLLRHKASALLAIGKNDDALATYDAILRAQPRDVQTLVEKADLLVWLSCYDDALSLYEQAIKYDSCNAEVFQKKGLALRLLQRLDAALQCYEQALKIDSRDPRAWWEQGDVWLEKDQFADAFRCYSEGDAVDSVKLYGASAWTDRGDQLLDRPNPEQAQFCYRKSIDIDPNYLWGWRGMGLALNALGKNEEALKVVDRALELVSQSDTSTATVWAEKGNVLFDLKRLPEATECYHKALKIDSANIVALINLGVICQDGGDYKGAIRFYDEALQVDDRRSEIWQNKGFCLAMLEKYEESIPCFEKAIVIDKSIILPWFNKAISLRELKRYSEAEQCFRSALEIATDENDKIDLLMQLGGLLGDRTWDYEGALQVYQRALEIRPGAHDIQAAVAECLIKVGKYVEGRQLALSIESHEKALRCTLSYLAVVSYALQGDGANFESAFKNFLSHFEGVSDPEQVRVTPEQWDYRGLLNIIANKSPDLRTQFLLSVCADLQRGTIETSKLAFFNPVVRQNSGRL